MARWPSRQFRGTRSRSWVLSRRRLGVVAAVTAVSVFLGTVAPVAFAAPLVGGGVPPARIFGYAKGPGQPFGSAAGKPHYVPASATRASGAGGARGHAAPKLPGIPSPFGSRTLVRVGAVKMPSGHLVTGTGAGGTGSPPPGAPSPSASPSSPASPSASPSPSTPPPASPNSPASPSPASPSGSPSPSTPASLTAYMSGGTDNASYSVASTFDTVPMADQSGRIAVTLTNTGTSTWTGYALGAKVFPAGDTTGTGTPLTTGPNVAISGTVAPNGTTTVESVTPAENPGSYEICWDAVNASGAYFSSEGGNQYCAPYTIQQYPAQVTEQEPLPGSDVDTQTPQLSATATVPGGYPPNPQFTFAFRILNGPNPATATVLQSSGWVSGNSNEWTPGTALSWGTTYYWQVTVTDAATPPSLSSVTWTTPISFTVGNAQPQVSGQFGPTYQADDGNPVMTSDLGGGDYSGSGKTVDPKTGNISQQVTDASVATAGPALAITRSYNSLDPRTSQALGAGWSSILDMSLAPDSDGSGALILTLADGQQVRFAKNAAGGYAPPQDFYAVISPVSGGGFTVTDQAGTTWTFTQASGSSWLLSKETDVTGKAETFTFSSGQLTTITNNVSGRSLHLTWATPSGAAHPHVATVATDPVSPGQSGTALTWTYSYSGDLLSSACPPGTTTACTSYGYITNASHAATAVMNTNPGAYYRLNDAPGAVAAANVEPVNELTTLDPPATEMHTTSGATGPISGVTATGFNGSSSWVPLDGTWCSTPGDESSCTWVPATGRVLTGNGLTSGDTKLNTLAVSLWFKTTSTRGVLAGISGTVAGGPQCLQVNSSNQCIKEPDAVPLLWVDANGHLAGLNGISTTSVNTSATSAMTSAATVNNGSWHQAVVIPGRALYLDGTQIATGSGQTLTLPGPPQGITAPDIAMLGTGLSSLCTGCNPPQWQYFNGSMADAAVWTNDVPGPDAIAAQHAAETTSAAELTTITSPAGRTMLSASYNTASDRVTSLTDAKGGTWTYTSPANTSTAGAYNSAVMADAPQDFWPLADTSGTQAGNLVGSAPTAANPRPPATYANVTLGHAGPMPDASAAGFTGSSSQVSIPSQDFSTAGPVSAEGWFKTSAGGQQFLLTGANSAVSGDPLVIALSGAAGTCLEAYLQDDPFHVAKQSTCGTSSNYVNDGAWHQAVATLSPASAPSNGKVTQTLTLYQDGQKVGSVQVSTSPTASPGTVTYIGRGFTGSLADVSVYPSTLTSAQVAGHYSALASQQGTTDPNGNPFTPVNTQTITVANPVGGTGKFVYATGALVETISPTGGISRYGYDAAMRADTITDQDGDTTYTVHDAHNNVTSTTTCAAVNNCQTTYTSYYENLSNALDPRNDKPTDSRDARSSSPYDPAYDTVTSYTAAAQIVSTTTPPTAACPSGCKTSYAYTTGTESAVGGGTEPAGLLKSVTTPGGGATSYAYNSAGDVAQVTDPLGMVTTYGYDNVGRQVSETQVSDSYPSGLTTSTAYDSQDRVVSQTDPGVTDRVTGAVHTKVTSYSHDADGNMLTSTVSDSTGGDPSRATTDTYDAHGNLASAKDALGNVTSYAYDGLGDKTSATNAAGVTTAYGYDNAGHLLTVTLDGYTGNPSNPIPAENLVLQSRAYDPAGRLASVTDVRGTTTAFTYYGNNKLASGYVVCSSCSGGQEQARTYGYDAAGNPLTQTAPGGLVVNTVYDADNKITSQAVDPSGVNRVATASYDANGNITAESLTGGGVTQTETATYNAMDQVLSQTTVNTGGNLTTMYQRDQRGLVIAETDPAGHTTTIQNDELGQAVVTTAPAVSAQNGTGSAPVTASPVTTDGYNTFGEVAEQSDANGNVTRYAYDQDGQQVTITDPSYTPPGASSPVSGTTTISYDNLGQQTSETDPLGNPTTYTYDQLGDKATQTDPGGGTWTYTYDPARDQLSVTDPTGAQTQATYDNLGRLATTTDLIRQNTSAAYTTNYAYDDAGNLISQTSPTGVKDTATYDAVREQTSVTDGAGNATHYAYNLDGKLVKETLADSTAVTGSYDLAGRQTSLSDLDASGTVLRTETAAYNPDSQVTSATDFRGNTSTFSYDATGVLASATQPVASGQSITVSYGYDLAGHRTALTDGNGNTTYTTYNSRGLPEITTEPPTAAHSTAADSQTVDIYNADGDLVTQNQPGGVQVTSTYNANGDLTGQSGTGASAPTATRNFTYDAAGRLLTAATSAAGTQGSFGYQPATSESFGWDDRGLLLSSAGTAGTTSYSYNGAGQETSVTNAAGTSGYTYDTAGRLATDADAASGATGSYSYNTLGQVTQIGYGTGGDAQSFGYDTLHRITSDTVKTSSGATVASIGYGYDNNDNVTSMTTTGLDTPSGTGAVTSSYAYDQANRLTSWTATPPGGAATTRTYGYDNNGNLVSNNGVSQTYDARNELTSDGSGNSYSYTANGNLAQQNSPGNAVYSFTSDAYGQQITDGFSSFAWDALDRVTSAGEAFNTSYNVTLTYDGLTKDVASDPSAAYSRDPAGQIIGVNSGAGGRTLALVNEHGDLSGTFTPAGTSLSSSSTWDPWGQLLASSGSAIQVGYQGQWTDPVTGQVSMGARMYRPPVSGFINQDTYTGGEGGPAVTDNLHAYANDNPVTLIDVSGHSPSRTSGSGGGITAGQVAAAYERAAAAGARATAATTAAAGLRAAAAALSAVAHGFAALARAFNSMAKLAQQAAAAAARAAAEAFARAQSELRQAEYWQQQANAAWAASWADLKKAATWEVWKIPGYLAAAAWEAGRALYDEAQAAYHFAQYLFYELIGSIAEQLSNVFHSLAMALSALARGAAGVAASLSAQAAGLSRKAQALSAYAAQQAALARQYLAYANHLAREYAAQQARKARAAAKRLLKKAAKVIKQIGRKLVSAAKTAGRGIAKAAVSTARFVAKHSKVIIEAGLAVGAVALTVINVAQLGLDPATDAAEAADVAALAGDVTAETASAGEGATAAEEGGSAAEEAGATCGGASFTASTKVLLASGAAIPISQLKVGDKVLATSTRTGKTQAETVAAVLVHRDTDLYDLTIRVGNKTAVIDTTRSHLFWVPGIRGSGGSWVKAGALRYGTHLRTSSGGTATVTGGWTSRVTAGWMWDLTIPGDHDFYIDTIAAPVLVHNCPRDIGHADIHQFPGIQAGKSQFFDNVNLDNLSDTGGIRGILQNNGNMRYVLRAPSDIGVDRTTGLPTDVYTVIRNSAGRVVTMFPGTSPMG
jgi:RHS repeat-associated protein